MNAGLKDDGSIEEYEDDLSESKLGGMLDAAVMRVQLDMVLDQMAKKEERLAVLEKVLAQHIQVQQALRDLMNG